MLDVVSALCDGQKKEMQNLLRHQENVFSVSTTLMMSEITCLKSVNIVEEIALLLETLARHQSASNILLIKKAIQVWKSQSGDDSLNDIGSY